MNLPQNLYYTKGHEWISATKDHAYVGISSYALEQLGEVVHIELPKIGDNFSSGDSFGTVESTKTVSDLYMPLNCTVVEINEQLINQPELLAADPYKNGWLVKVHIQHTQQEKLFSNDEYQTYIKEN